MRIKVEQAKRIAESLRLSPQDSEEFLWLAAMEHFPEEVRPVFARIWEAYRSLPDLERRVEEMAREMGKRAKK